LHPGSELTGVAPSDTTPSDPDSVMRVIEDAREEALRRRLEAHPEELPR
jgi:hypothetical protein